MISPYFLYISRNETSRAAAGRRQPFHLASLRTYSEPVRRAASLQMAIHFHSHLVDIERLGEVHQRAEIRRFLNHIEFAVSRHHNDLDGRIDRFDML